MFLIKKFFIFNFLLVGAFYALFSDVVFSRENRLSFDSCKPILTRCFPNFDPNTFKFNSSDKGCLTKGKSCLSIVKGLAINCEKVLEPCFNNACSGSACSDVTSNESLGMSCLSSTGIQYQYKCNNKLKFFASSYASKAKSFADAEANRIKQMEIQSKQQTEQAQIQAQAAQSQNQIASQERIKMAELQLQKEEAERQAKERELERQAQEKANRNPNSDVIVRLNELKKVLNFMDNSVSEAKDVAGYVKYKLVGDSQLNNDIMWFKPSRNVLSSLTLNGGKWRYRGNVFDYSTMDMLDTDAMSSMVSDNKTGEASQNNKAGVYYTCSKNVNTGIVQVPLSNYYKRVQEFLSSFEDIILIAKDSPEAMNEIDFTCVDSVQVFVQPLNEYINELASINKTALCSFDSSSLMNALGGIGGVGSGGLPRGKDGRFLRLDSSGGQNNKTFELLNSALSSSDDSGLGGQYNKELLSTDGKSDPVAGAKVARAVGYASDINRALMYCYTNTLQAMKNVLIANNKNNSNNNMNMMHSASGLTGLIARIGNLKRTEKNDNGQKVYIADKAEVSALCNDISDYAVMQNISDKYQQYNSCKICTIASEQSYDIVVNSLRGCIQSLVNTTPNNTGGMMPQLPASGSIPQG